MVADRVGTGTPSKVERINLDHIERKCWLGVFFTGTVVYVPWVGWGVADPCFAGPTDHDMRCVCHGECFVDFADSVLT